MSARKNEGSEWRSSVLKKWRAVKMEPQVTSMTGMNRFVACATGVRAAVPAIRWSRHCRMTRPSMPSQKLKKRLVCTLVHRST